MRRSCASVARRAAETRCVGSAASASRTALAGVQIVVVNIIILGVIWVELSRTYQRVEIIRGDSHPGIPVPDIVAVPLAGTNVWQRPSEAPPPPGE
jgi:hypothetical protein